MTAPDEHKPPERSEEEVAETVGRKAARKLRARRGEPRTVWFGLGMFGLVGWSVAIPAIAGIALGVWLDNRLQDRISWTLTLLFAGIALGCLNAWMWIKRESRDD